MKGIIGKERRDLKVGVLKYKGSNHQIPFLSTFPFGGPNSMDYR